MVTLSAARPACSSREVTLPDLQDGPLTYSTYELPRNNTRPESTGTNYQTAISQVPFDGKTHAQWADNQRRLVGQSQN